MKTGIGHRASASGAGGRLDRLTRSLIGALVMVALAAWAPQAQAQVSNLKVRLTDNWVLHPAFNSNTLAGYLAQQVAGAPAPNGFTIVWFARRPHDTKGTAHLQRDTMASERLWMWSRITPPSFWNGPPAQIESCTETIRSLCWSPASA